MTVTKVTARAQKKQPAAARVQPLYHQVYLQLRQWLVEHPQDPDLPLPAEPALAERFGVSRVTIRKTLERLQNEGLILRKHGKGTFPTRQSQGSDNANISSVLDNLLSLDARSSADLLEWGAIALDDGLARQLNCKTALRIVRLRRIDGVPHSYTTLLVPEALAPLLDDERDRSEPIVRVMERHGIVAERADQILTARPADARRALALGVAQGSALTVMRRLMFSADHGPVLYQESCYNPDRFEYRMTLSRLSAGPVAQWVPIF
jgi:GntR family transcriptional regulator